MIVAYDTRPPRVCFCIFTQSDGVLTTEELNDRISQLLTPKGMKAEVKIVFQSIEGLHAACPNHQGDWYFTGDFPTPGGHKVVNRAFVYYVEGRNDRAY